MARVPKLEKFPASSDDPGGPLKPGEYWYFWQVYDRKRRIWVKGRVRKKG